MVLSIARVAGVDRVVVPVFDVGSTVDRILRRGAGIGNSGIFGVVKSPEGLAVRWGIRRDSLGNFPAGLISKQIRAGHLYL